jgi:hypothetical protein
MQNAQAAEIEATGRVCVGRRAIRRSRANRLERPGNRTGHNPTELGNDTKASSAKPLAISAISPHLTKTRRNCPANPLIPWGIKFPAKFPAGQITPRSFAPLTFPEPAARVGHVCKRPFPHD